MRPGGSLTAAAEPTGAGPPLGRVSVVGNSGSGKTTVARRLAAILGVPHLELDAVFHQPNWTPLPDAEFRRRVEAFTAAPGWVVDGNYATVQDIVWSRADTVVWLDLSRGRVMRQLIWRTVRRAALREELWNGNRESFRNALSRDPDVSVIRWAWHDHDPKTERYSEAMSDPGLGHLRFVRLTSPAAVRAWLASPWSAIPGSRGGSVES